MWIKDPRVGSAVVITPSCREELTMLKRKTCASLALILALGATPAFAQRHG
jgi:hypothetical protein